MLKATFEHLASGADPRIKAVYPFADERATTLIVEVDSADDLGQLISSLPATRLSTFVSHPVASPQSVLEQLSEGERIMAGRPATAGA